MPIIKYNSARDLIFQEPDFFRHVPEISEKWKSVRQQSSGHMLRESVTHLYDVVRPNEPSEVRDYRQTVHRDITAVGPWNFISKVTRIFLDNDIRPNYDNMSDAMFEWITGQPFYESYTIQFDVEQFMYQVLLPFTMNDPNGFLIAFPFNDRAPDIAPSEPVELGGLSPLERVNIENILISSADVVFISDRVLAWNAGKMEWKKGMSEPYYFVVDDYEFILYYPTTDGNKLIYRAESWYFHGLGSVPAQQVGGILTRFDSQPHQSGEMQFYFESFLRPYFTFADEFVTAFSDNQAIRIQHAYPKQVMKPIPCINPQCEDGKIRIRDPESGQIISKHTCGTCHGSGYITNPGPYNVLIREDAPGIENSGPVLEYVVPPPDIIQHSYDVSFDLLTRGKKAIGLDILENLMESGVAKSMRLDDLRDKLWSVAANIRRVMQNHLIAVERMLNIDSSEQVEPVVYLPQRIHFTDRSLLKEEAETSLLIDRENSQLSYLRQKYRDDDVQFRIYEIAFDIAPLMLLNESETSQALAVGAYGPIDVIRRDKVIQVLTEIAETVGANDFLSADTNTVIEVAETLLSQYYPTFDDGSFFGNDVNVQSGDGGDQAVTDDQSIEENQTVA